MPRRVSARFIMQLQFYFVAAVGVAGHMGAEVFAAGDEIGQQVGIGAQSGQTDLGFVAIHR